MFQHKKKALYILLCMTFTLSIIILCGCAAPSRTASATQKESAVPSSDLGQTPDRDISDENDRTDSSDQTDTNDMTDKNDNRADSSDQNHPKDVSDQNDRADSSGQNNPISTSSQNSSADSSCQNDTKNMSNQDGSTNISSQNNMTPIKNSVSDLYRQILGSGTKQFFGSHPIDTAFLKWLSKKYGRSCIERLAEAAVTGRQKTALWHKLTGNSIHVLWLLYCRQTGLHPKQLENVTWQDCASDKEITLAFTGDLNFSEGYSTTSHLDSRPNGIYDCFSKDLLTLMKDMDIMMLNNEFTYSTRGTPLPGKAFTFRAHPSRAGLLKVFGTDIVNLANNHVYDYGPDALLDTIATLDQEGIPHIGAGADLKKASEPYYFVCNGRKIALAAATQIERSTNYTKEATQNTPGVLKTLNPDKFTAVIKKAKKNSDYVIAVVHWGTEGSSYYGQDQKDLAEAFAAAGADAIIGGHTHCLQGFEIIDGVPVLYSTGNFWFSRRTQDTGLAKITINKKGKLTMSFIPCIQENLRTYLVTDEAQKQRIFTSLQQISAPNVRLTKNGIVKPAEQ